MPRRSAVLLVTLISGAALPAAACASELEADPSNFESAFNSARAGDVIVLASGAYGNFNGGRKSGMVTILAAPGASVSMGDLVLENAQNLTFDGLQLGEIEIRGQSTRNITVRNSTITDQTTFRTGELANANILFDRNVHPAWDKCDGCGEGRVFLPEKRAEPSGITIQNSRFGPGGDSDGIQNGSNGTRILNNEFVGIRQLANGEAHADSIQLYGSRNTVIRGNWFHDVSVGVMAPDGADHELIEDNVIQARSPYAINLKSDDGSVVRHNTLPDGSCDYNQRCGWILLGAKSGNPASRGTVIRDNIMAGVSWGGQTAAEDFNLFAASRGRGANSQRGLPTYVGGPAPTSYAGFRLAPGSRGKGNASDGLDRGARIGVAAGPPRAGGKGRKLRPYVRLVSSRRAIRRHRRVRVRVRTLVPATIALTAKIRPKGRPGARAVRLKKKVTLKFARAGHRDLTLRLSRHARRRVLRWGKPQLVVTTFADAARTRPSGLFVLRIRR
jgi:Right handed beta helix region